MSEQAKQKSVWSWIGYPVLASMIRTRAIAAVLAGVLLLQLFSVVVKIKAISCPMLEATGVPCPGCGLTRGAVASLHLDWAGLLHYNAFGPLALLAVVIVLIGAVLPGRYREAFANRIAWIEQHTGITNLCFVALWVYWMARMVSTGGELGSTLITSIH